MVQWKECGHCRSHGKRSLQAPKSPNTSGARRSHGVFLPFFFPLFTHPRGPSAQILWIQLHQCTDLSCSGQHQPIFFRKTAWAQKQGGPQACRKTIVPVASPATDEHTMREALFAVLVFWLRTCISLFTLSASANQGCLLSWTTPFQKPGQLHTEFSITRTKEAEMTQQLSTCQQNPKS